MDVRGRRPFAPVERRYDWRYLVGFVHPASGRTVFHLATSVSIPSSRSNWPSSLASQADAWPDKQIVVVLDRAGWHTSLHLRVPDHVHLLFLPPHSPELQPAEHLWPLTNTVLANRHFASIEDLEGTQARTASPSKHTAGSSAPPPASIGGLSGSRIDEDRNGCDITPRERNIAPRLVIRIEGIEQDLTLPQLVVDSV